MKEDVFSFLMNATVTAEEQAKQIACELLASYKCGYEKYLGAVRTSEVDPKLGLKIDRDLWIVYFKAKIPPGVIRVIPDTIIVEVDPRTGKAEIFPSL